MRQFLLFYAYFECSRTISNDNWHRISSNFNYSMPVIKIMVLKWHRISIKF